MKLLRLSFFLQIGLTNILGFLSEDILLDEMRKKEVYAMTMDGGNEGLSRGGGEQE